MKLAGQIIHRLRWSKGWSLTELAYRAGISVDTLSAIENGSSEGSPRTGLGLSQALGVDVLDIAIDDSGPKPVVLGPIGRAVALDILPENQ